MKLEKMFIKICAPNGMLVRNDATPLSTDQV